MTEAQALRAMFLYLDARWSENQAIELGSILGDLQPDEDGQPFDPAVKQDWHRAVQKALGEQ